MIDVKIGISKNKKIKNAVKEATSDFGNPLLIIVCAEVSIFSDTIKIVSEKYPKATVIGTTGYYLSYGGANEEGMVLIAIEGWISISADTIENVSKYPVLSIEKVRNSVKKINAGEENTVCLEFCTGNEEVLVSTLNSILKKNNIKLIGGTSQGVNENLEKLVALNGNIYNDAAVYVFIKNLNGKIKTYSENIYKDNNERMLITKVDELDRRIIEIDGKSAEDVYCEKLNISHDDIEKYSMRNPLSRVIGDDTFITAINYNEKGGLQCFKRINKNDTVTIMELDDYEKIVDDTCNKIKEDFNKISFVLSFNCIVRYMLFKDLDYIDTYSRKMQSLGNHLGIITEGEQYINQHINQTMVCVVFE